MPARSRVIGWTWGRILLEPTEHKRIDALTSRVVFSPSSGWCTARDAPGWRGSAEHFVLSSEHRVLRTPFRVLSGMSHDYANSFSVSNIRPAERYLMRDLPIVSTVAIGWSNQDLS